MDKVKQRHSQMTNTAKQKCSSGIYDNKKPDNWTKVEDQPPKGTNHLFDKYSFPQLGAPNMKSRSKLKNGSTPSTPVSGGQ
jgi:hypothetical protein